MVEKEVNIKDLILKIDNILTKGQNVTMKNKEKFQKTLLKTKAILSNNQSFFNENNNSDKMSSYLMELESIILDVESNLTKLSLIKFCRDKAEKYLEQKTEKLEQNNIFLTLQLAMPKTDNIAKEEEIDVEPFKIEIKSLKDRIKLLEQEKLILSNELSELKAKEAKRENIRDMYVNDSKILEGLRALHGINGRVNYQIAYEYFNQVAEADNECTEAKVLLAQMYEKGYYVDQSYHMAYSLYLDASERGNVQATYMLGVYAENNFYGIFEKNKGVDCYKIAMDYYNDAAKKGYGDAIAKIGLAMDKGILHNKTNEKLGIEYYQKAIGIDKNPVALNGLGSYNYRQKNYVAAYENFLEAAKSLNPDALNNLGVCYEYGKGINPNLSKALDCYKKASRYNHPNALINQAILLIKMDIRANVKDHFNECFRLLLLGTSLDNKNKEGFYYLGLLFEIGFDLFGNNNIIPNYPISFHFYKKAAELGHLKAKTKFGIATYNGISNMFFSDQEKGTKIVQEAANQGDSLATNFLYQTSTNQKIS